MKRHLAVAVVFLALVGCQGGERTGAPEQPSAAPAVAEPAEAAPCVPTPSFYSPLPDAAIRFDFPFRIARDRVYATDSGEARRGVTLEYLAGTPEDVWSGIVQSMEKAGFHLADSAGSNLKGTFVKQGTPSMYLALTPEAGATQTGPDVLGSIWISWKLEKAVQADPGQAGQ